MGEHLIDVSRSRKVQLLLGDRLGLMIEQASLLAQNLAEIKQGGVEPVLQGDVWIDANDLVHRVSLAYDLGEMAGGGTMTVTFDFRQHGEPLDLGIPAPEETVDLATLGG